MKKFAYLILLLPSLSLAHVCDKLNQIPGFHSSELFQHAIINNKPLDYLTFQSECDLECLFRTLNTQNIRYNLSANNIGIFDKGSVATLTIEQAHNPVTGYLTCSSTERRSYIPNPVHLNTKKVLQDLQTEDNTTISRTITMGNYSSAEYSQLVQNLNNKAENKNSEVGFTNYYIHTNNLQTLVKLTAIDENGGFILIVERKK